MPHSRSLIYRDQYFCRVSELVQKKFDAQKFFGIVTQKQARAVKKSTCCAATFLVSEILRCYDLIRSRHIDLTSLLREMKRHSWREVKDLRVGAVLVWQAVDGERHVGFFSGHEHAISLHHQFNFPYKHHKTFGSHFSGDSNQVIIPVRPITEILWHPHLNSPAA